MKKLIYFIILFLLGPPAGLLAQTTTGELRVTVKGGDAPLEFAGVGVLLDNSMVTSGTTDENGQIIFKSVNPGSYTVKVHMIGYHQYELPGVIIAVDRPTSITIKMVSAETIFDTLVVRPKFGYIPPLITPGKISTDFYNIQNNAARGNIAQMMNQGARIFSLDGGAISVAGTRPGSLRVYWNGVAVNNMSLSGIPSRALQSLSVLTGAVSAEYGDFVGGAAIFTTPRPGLNRITSIEGISSSLFDKYHNNYAEFFSMAPLIIKNKGRDSAKTVLGYILSANYQYQADRSPSAIGVWRVRPDKLKQLEANPIQSSPKGQGFVPTAEFITAADLEKVSYHENVPSHNASVIGELNFVPDSRRQLLLGAKYDYTNAINYFFENNLFNAANNSQSINHNLLTYINYNHILKDENDKGKGPLKSASYNIRLDYQSSWSKTQDAVHGDRFFDYGYVGRFKTYSAPAYEFRGVNEGGNPDSLIINGQKIYLKNYYRQTGNRPVDTLVTFDRGNTRNPIRANYTSLYYDLLGQENINSLTGIRGSGAGLVNGQNPIGVYSNMWNNVGMGVQTYGKSQNEQMGLNATGQFATGMHEVRFGVYYEQRIQRGWSIDANSLWPLMTQLANNGLELDKDNPILVRDENGVFLDTIKYNYRQNASQSEFDKRFREQLMKQGATNHYGNPITETTFIDINSYDPSDFSLSLFTADELLNNGNGFVNYFGYDYKGNKVRGNSSISDFTGDRLNRPVSAYMPSYAAAFVQDKISFKSLTIRAGLRLERYDNNLPVLKDPYLLFPAYTAGEVKSIAGHDVNHPSSVGDDYTVYVDDARNPTAITGYRKNNIWYNADGLQVTDPAVIAEKSKSSTIQPWLVNPGQKSVDGSAFTDFKPGILALPRLYFDFPVIEDVSRFFASYDVLAQRPGNNYATMASYYYLPFNSTGVINNPNLKPQITTNYEVGFSQRVSARSAITLIASYREQRNLIQLFRYNYAYPVSYTSFANIDFATVKSFTAQYNFREWGKFDMEASYTLQFADGTGSAAGSQQALVAVGQPNLRTLFPLSFDVRHNIKMNFSFNFGSGDSYTGPIWFKSKVFENAGWSVNLNAFSGLPYTANSIPTPEAQSQTTRSPIKGTPYGSRLPWQLQNDLSIFKETPVKLGKTKSGDAKTGMLRFTLWMNNFLDVKNIRAIHSFTGSATTDGWLSSEQGKKAISEAVSSQAYVDLYNTAMANPGFYTMPRRVRLGISLSF